MAVSKCLWTWNNRLALSIVASRNRHFVERRPGRFPRSGRTRAAATKTAERRNELAPGKRMLSPLAPAIVCRDGKLALVVGAAAGRESPGVVLTLLTNMLDFQMDPASALDAPRWRPRGQAHQCWNSRATRKKPTRARPARPAFHGLYAAEHAAAPLGDAQAIRVRDGVSFRRGGSSPRRRGCGGWLGRSGLNALDPAKENRARE